ncbi:MAG TPA: YcxB family protein [Planctomycetaceae bacterium]|jgi:hypothetical protein|nr:YcxB family protein [Planctomycetaceae bacterium]
MEITFRLREEDFQAACEHRLSRSPTWRHFIPRIVIGVCALWIVFGSLLWSVSHDLFTVGGFLLFGLILAAILPSAVRKARRDGDAAFYRDERNRMLREPFTLRLEEDGLACDRASGWSKTRWAYVDSVFQTEHHLFIYLASLSAFIVPKDGVISGEYDSFACEVEKRSRTAAARADGL